MIVADRTEEPREGGEKTVAAITREGGSARFVPCDVTNADALANAIQEARSLVESGRLDIIVNNAAIGASKNLLETSEAEWDQVLEVNAKGVFLGCREAVKVMLEQEPLGPEADICGRIVNISSQHGMVCSPGDIAYGVGKAAVVYMTRQIAVDYAEHGIVCNAVAPGKILTGKTGPAILEESLSYSHARTPWPRLGKPRDVAGAVLFLASDDASYITGENLMVDGGWMAY